MATRTFIGGNMNAESSWVEGAVPVAGDDVVIPASAGNGYLTADLPSSGQLRSFIVDNDYTGTINFGDFKVYAGQGNFAGVIFDSGTNANYQCGTGGVQFYSTSTTITGVNIVKANNPNMANVNVFLSVNGFNRYLDIQTDFYCKNLIFLNVNAILATRNIKIYVYGSLTETASIGLNDRCFSVGVNEMILNGSGNISLNNGLHTLNKFTINGSYNLTNNFNLYVANTQNNDAGIYLNSNATLNCNGFDLILTTASSTYAAFVNLQNTIQRLVLKYDTYGIIGSGLLFRISSPLNITEYLGFIGSELTRGRICTIRSNTNGVKVPINLSNNCKYMMYYMNLVDLQFNKPVTAFKSSVTRCDNIKVIDYPNVYKTIQ